MQYFGDGAWATSVVRLRDGGDEKGWCIQEAASACTPKDAPVSNDR